MLLTAVNRATTESLSRTAYVMGSDEVLQARTVTGGTPTHSVEQV
ncbi:hypothetical protein [Nigerium massiliense]|nr:hypothetical protein [Nigerium massiliense]